MIHLNAAGQPGACSSPCDPLTATREPHNLTPNAQTQPGRLAGAHTAQSQSSNHYQSLLRPSCHTLPPAQQRAVLCIHNTALSGRLQALLCTQTPRSTTAAAADAAVCCASVAYGPLERPGTGNRALRQHSSSSSSSRRPYIRNGSSSSACMAAPLPSLSSSSSRRCLGVQGRQMLLLLVLPLPAAQSV